MLSLGKKEREKESWVFPFSPLPRCPLESVPSPRPPYPVSFSDFKDRFGKFPVLRAVAEVSAILAGRSVIYVFRERTPLCGATGRGLAVMPESLRGRGRGSAFASDPGCGCPLLLTQGEAVLCF